MNYGFNIAASGVLTSLHRQDVAANNLANIETVGFKPDFSVTLPRQAARAEDGVWNLPSNALLEKLGAGVLLAPTRTSFGQGPIERTGNQLDVAIKGNGFLVVQGEGGKGGQADQPRLTRDGRLGINSSGQLVTVIDRKPVLDEADRPIVLRPDLPVKIDSEGTITQGLQEVARLKFIDVPDKLRLKKEGTSLFSADAGVLAAATPADGEIVQKAVERSAVDPIMAMMGVQDAANATAAGMRVMQIHDELTGRAIASLGRVA